MTCVCVQVASTIALRAASHGALSREVVPPEAPGTEPENARVKHPKIVTPTFVEKHLVPSVGTALTLLAAAVAAVVLRVVIRRK